MTGTELQSAFGLLTTYAAFTTISTYAGRLPATDLGSWRELVRAVPVVGQLLDAPGPAVRGAVFPGKKGAVITVQMRTARGWRMVHDHSS